MLFKNEWSFENDYDKINNIWDDVRLRVFLRVQFVQSASFSVHPEKETIAKQNRFAIASLLLKFKYRLLLFCWCAFMFYAKVFISLCRCHSAAGCTV